MNRGLHARGGYTNIRSTVKRRLRSGRHAMTRRRASWIRYGPTRAKTAMRSTAAADASTVHDPKKPIRSRDHAAAALSRATPGWQDYVALAGLRCAELLAFAR